MSYLRATAECGEEKSLLENLEKVNGLVRVDSDDDPNKPQFYSQEWTLMFWMGAMSTFSPMASSLFAPGISLTLQEYEFSSPTVGSLVISVYILCAFFNALILGCSFAPDMPSLIIMRPLAGIGGSAVMTIVSAIIRDVFPVHKRAAASFGPIAGGFISEYLRWRWNGLGRDDIHSHLEIRMPPRKVLARSIVRPVKSNYNFEPKFTELAYLGLGVGMFIALGIIMRFNDPTVRTPRLFTPFAAEMRPSRTIYFAPFMHLALFIYSWASHYQVHWIIPCLSFGLLSIFIPCQTYMVDAFLATSAPAVCALVCLRSIFGVFLPLIGPKVYESVGLGWEDTLLRFITLVVTLVPFAFLKYGG
ncbi:MFS general substrate transporter [Zopfia rhizophila CBS 207.26]|uniref:MFS general substrate transporter n=1 Tax=Zopfia rhizophila CBS 207.26 TaxID=1314779 RepID=A0A6A6EID3_9PEZI|nr:MFS general substrate transporter [Zopfia rhizophila CBS 207.26]